MASEPDMPAGAPALEEVPARRGFAMGLMIVSSAMLSFGGLVIRYIETENSWQINLYRSLALMSAVAIVLGVRYRGEALSRVRGVGAAGLAAGCLLGCASIAFLQAITNTTVANTLFTVSTIPFITAVLAYLFLEERLGRTTLVTMGFAALGVFIMIAEGIGTGSAYGNMMALLTAFAFACFAVIVRRHREVDMLPTLLVSGGFIVIVALAVTWRDLAISPLDLALCFVLGGIVSGFGNSLFVAASRHLVAAELTFFTLLEFALGPLWVWLFINEVPGAWSLAGGALVIAAVAARALVELGAARGPRLRRGRPSPL